MWLTTVNGVENRNREVINVRRRWNATWQLSNEAISAENPDGGYQRHRVVALPVRRF
jgi:hypothetical protein